MAENYTEHYGLCQWEEDDSFLRTDFNGDNEKIDAALAEKCRAVIGFYIGNGAATRVVELGFRPKAVHLEDGCGNRATNSAFQIGGLTVDGMHTLNIKIKDSGFEVYNARDYMTNLSSREYAYIAYY